MIICASGHRPDKLPFGYQLNNPFELVLKEKLKTILLQEKPNYCISGFAQGMDQIFFQACLDLEIPCKAYIPFIGQEKFWPQESQNKYNELLSKASEIKIICEGNYASWKMQKRNQAMSDDSDLAIVLYDGSGGGTKNFITYHQLMNNRKIILIHPDDIIYA